MLNHQYSPLKSTLLIYSYHYNCCFTEVLRNPGSHLFCNLVRSARGRAKNLGHWKQKQQVASVCLAFCTLNPLCVHWLDNIQQ